jgi:hypothetical protein
MCLSFSEVVCFGELIEGGVCVLLAGDSCVLEAKTCRF